MRQNPNPEFRIVCHRSNPNPATNSTPESPDNFCRRAGTDGHSFGHHALPLSLARRRAWRSAEILRIATGGRYEVGNHETIRCHVGKFWASRRLPEHTRTRQPSLLNIGKMPLKFVVLVFRMSRGRLGECLSFCKPCPDS